MKYIYIKTRQKLIDILNKEELTENENKLKCEYINAKPIIKEWIEEEKRKCFTDIKETIKHYGHTSVAKYFANFYNNN